MKTKFTLTLTLFMALIVQLTFAQQRTISGTVSDENGLPLFGATVVISGTSTVTTTDSAVIVCSGDFGFPTNYGPYETTLTKQ